MSRGRTGRLADFIEPSFTIACEAVRLGFLRRQLVTFLWRS
jgi:hypothetical protein